MLNSVKLTFNSPRSEIMKIFTDPFRLSGIISHFVILQVYDTASETFVSPGKVTLEKLPNYYKVLYVFGTPDTGIRTLLGTLKGPEIIMGGVEYKGKDVDNTFELTMQFLSQELSNKTVITINANLIYNPSLKHKIFGKEIRELKKEFDFPNHIIKDHIVPYLNLTFKLEETLYEEEKGEEES
ncbi:hypothetical protein [Stygiolobus caldivivus]|uniref:Uncharacterized protein n=1 Tax=Stygiolobus caldivivus TaxID=2824673 RepID=A0A8D5ZIY0_9CREN|nr:hypothetical protein [Stygiolobus caldivivus]BCU70994.1 hypothetical protein KN1_22910 [Stygiolobus caldivivus]